jgi:hypothetical protein
MGMGPTLAPCKPGPKLAIHGQQRSQRADQHHPRAAAEAEVVVPAEAVNLRHFIALQFLFFSVLQVPPACTCRQGASEDGLQSICCIVGV